METELDKIKNRIGIPFDERDERPHFYLIISKNKTSIEMLDKYVEYLKNCLDIKKDVE